jgi:hypothetical protein
MVNMLAECFDRRFEEHSGNVEARIFLWNTFRLEKLGGMTGQEGINPSICNVSPKTFHAIVESFRPGYRFVV